VSGYVAEHPQAGIEIGYAIGWTLSPAALRSEFGESIFYNPTLHRFKIRRAALRAGVYALRLRVVAAG
tara:strand:+ start:651 stop:854 length:204 start_codon:yes stop_codon:yes gene_type:complete